MRRWAADLLSVTRLVLLLPWMWYAVRGSFLALPVMAAIAATDLLDGPLARGLSTSGPRGALFDAGCDAATVVVAAMTLGARDVRYGVLGGVAAAAFLVWGIRCRFAGRLVHTRLGRYDGVLCYLVLLAASLRLWLEHFRLQYPPVAETALLALTVAWLTLSAVENVTETVSRLRRPE